MEDEMPPDIDAVAPEKNAASDSAYQILLTLHGQTF
jgi:hypothetical protein